VTNALLSIVVGLQHDPISTSFLFRIRWCWSRAFQ